MALTQYEKNLDTFSEALEIYKKEGLKCALEHLSKRPRYVKVWLFEHIFKKQGLNLVCNRNGKCHISYIDEGKRYAKDELFGYIYSSCNVNEIFDDYQKVIDDFNTNYPRNVEKFKNEFPNR